MSIDLDKLAELNRQRTSGKWSPNEDDGSIYSNESEFVGEFDLNFADEAFVLELVNSADELLRLAKLGRVAEKSKT